MLRAQSALVQLNLAGLLSLTIITLVLCARALGQPAGDDAISPAALRTTELGSARSPITIIAFLDFQCPYCARSTSVLKELTDLYPKELRLVIKNSPLNIHPDAKLLHEAAMAAAAQGKFWEMYAALYTRQTKKIDVDGLTQLAKSLGMNAEAFRRDLNSHRYLPLVERDRLEARALGVEYTPTFFVNGKKIEGFASFPMLKQAVDDELRKISPALLKVAGLPERRITDIDVTNAPMRGTPGASVQIIEFADMQCPYCAKQVEALKSLVNAYPGKIAWYYKNYPLSFHPDSPLAHQALTAAKAQGKFWEMHDAIYANQASIKRNDLIRLAAQIGLDLAKFNADIDGLQYRNDIEKDKSDGEQLGVNGTPTMFINGRAITGIHTYAELQNIVDDELKIGPQAPAGNINPTAIAALPKTDLTRGPANAKVTITWFADLSSTLTGQSDELLQAIQSKHPKDVKVMFKNRPVLVNSDSQRVHEAAMAAAAADKFWDMERKLAALKQRPTREDLTRIAKDIGMDPQKLDAALDAGTYRDAVTRDVLEARRRDVRGSPVFFVNATRLDGVQPLADFEKAVESELERVNSDMATNPDTALPKVGETKGQVSENR